MSMHGNTSPLGGGSHQSVLQTRSEDLAGSCIELLLEASIGETVFIGRHESSMEEFAREACRFRGADIKVVAFGGGTGLSTVIGGNSRIRNVPAASGQLLPRQCEERGLRRALLDFFRCVVFRYAS